MTRGVSSRNFSTMAGGSPTRGWRCRKRMVDSSPDSCKTCSVFESTNLARPWTNRILRRDRAGRVRGELTHDFVYARRSLGGQRTARRR
jgi:hypothetical protein